jgi:transposase InsO family protein
MGLERYVVDAVLLERRSPREIARLHGISKSWVYQLLSRYHAGGYGALTPRSRRPRSCAHEVAPDLQASIVRLRHDLADAGHDAGAATIAHHLALTDADVPSVATIWRILSRHGLITPQPHKRPRSSFIRFEAALPNEMWQADSSHWHLADGTDVEILNVVDDHSRLLLASDAFVTVKAADVVQTFYSACSQHGYPAALLTDNGAVFTAKSRKGKVLLESELERLGITCKHSTPYHPQTCGKVERFHQTLKRFLDKQAPAQSLAHLQLQLDTFRAYYNQLRPHRALQGRTPLVAFHARLKARPDGPAPTTHFRVRHDRVDKAGRVTLRYLSRLHHIGLGRAHIGEPVRLLVANKHVRVIREDGFLIRELTLDPTRDYQPLGTPLGRPSVHNVVRQESTIS